MIKVLNFKNDQIPQYDERKNRNGWIDYGQDNLYPIYLQSLMNKSSKHNAILKGKAQMISGNGFDKANLSPEAIEFLDNKWGIYDNRHTSIDEIAARIGYDLEMYGAFTLDIIWSNDKSKIAAINYVDISKIRVENTTEKIPGYLVCNDWQNRKAERLFVNPFNPKNKGGQQILMVKEYRPGVEVYGQPEYLSAVNWIELEWEVSSFHCNSVKSGFAPSMIINFTDGIPSEEAMMTEISRLRAEYEGATNAGKVIFTFSEDRDKAPIITPVSLNDSDQKYIELNKEITKGILMGHRVTDPELFGEAIPGELGGSKNIVQSLRVFQSMYVTPKQKIIERTFNELARVNGIQDEFKLTKYQLEVEINLSVKDLLEILGSPINNDQKKQILIVSGYSEEEASNLVDAGQTQNNIQNNG